MGQGMGEMQGASMPIPLSLHLCTFSNPEALPTLSFWVFKEASSHYFGTID